MAATNPSSAIDTPGIGTLPHIQEDRHAMIIGPCRYAAHQEYPTGLIAQTFIVREAVTAICTSCRRSSLVRIEYRNALVRRARLRDGTGKIIALNCAPAFA